VRPLESVPNVSEGRDDAVIAAVGDAFALGARLLDVHTDADHNRSVYTLIGSEGDDALVESLLAGIAVACESIDLRRHHGVHPRVGAADVVPLVPLRAEDMDRARAMALLLAARVGEDLGLPVFLYGEVGVDRRPAYFRRGGLEELARRVETGELVPDFGPREIDQRVGVVLVGARTPLVAFNVVLTSEDVEIAREVAASVRESGGGIAGVQAIGLRLASTGRVQVSVNLIDVERASLHEVVDRIAREAEARSVMVEGSELVGLLPARVALDAAAGPLWLPQLDPSQVLELRLLEDLP